jgi:hypothetical protein
VKQQGNERTRYGEKVIEGISEKLQNVFGEMHASILSGLPTSFIESET